MKKIFLTALLVAMVSASTTFAEENFSAANAGLKLGTGNQSFVQMASNRAKATATFQNDLRARLASALVMTASKFKSDIRLETEDRKVNAKSIMQILNVGFKTGTEVTIVAEGSDAQEAVETIREFIDAGCPEL